MVTSQNRIMEVKGMTAAADLVERLVFNAGQGGRLPVLTACSYCTQDNRQLVNSAGEGFRDGYWPTHGAACCTLNAGRLMPYFVEGMWMRKDNGLAAMLYRPMQRDDGDQGRKGQDRGEDGLSILG